MEQTIESLLYNGNKYKVNLEQTVKGIEDSYLMLKITENFIQYLPTLYYLKDEIQKI